LKESAAYPKGYGARLLELHKPIMVCGSAFMSYNLHSRKNMSSLILRTLGQQWFPERIPAQSSGQHVEGRGKGLVLKTFLIPASPCPALPCCEVPANNVWDAADLPSMQQTLQKLAKDGFFHKIR
jgi:hypothetical protein